ncbi:unnamed protein product [Rhizophagus irregularis]|nr:unnamed protein product [Rhizophagus irregularis]
MPRHKKSSKGHSWGNLIVVYNKGQYSGKNTTRVPSPPPPSSQQSQTEKEQEQRTRACFQISNDSTVGDDESIWDEGDQPTTSYNIARKLSNIEEDVCYPLRTTNKGDGIDYNALEEYTTEEKTSAKKDEGNYHLLPQVITQGAKPSVNFCWTLSSVMQIRSSDSYEFVPDAPLPTYEQIIENGWLV